MRAQGGGAIVNISSGTPFRGVPFLLHYVTSKGAIVAFTRALAKELGKDGVRVNCVAPGFTMSQGVTRASRGRREAPRRLGRGADDPARPGAGGRRRRGRLSRRRGVVFVTGQTIVIDGGQTSIEIVEMRLLALRVRQPGSRPSAETASSTTSRATRPLRRGARRGQALVWQLDARRGRGRRAPLARGRARPVRRLDHALRHGRLPAGWRRLPAHPPRAWHPLLLAVGSRSRTNGHSTLRPGWSLVRERAGCRSMRAASAHGDRRSSGCWSLPAEWAGKRTIRYVDPADEDRPKLQRATIHCEHPLQLPR